MVAVAGLLTGCAQGALSTRESRIGPDDGTDACRAQLVALDSTGNFFGAQILTGAAIGAAGGALAGGLIGRDLKGALIGAVAGGVLGAAGGYWSAVQQQRSDQAGMFAQVGGDLSRENAQIDRTQLAFDQLMDCRFRQAEAIRHDYAAHRIDRTLAVARMNTVKQRAERDLALARQINQQIADRGAQFVVAADNLAPGAKTAIAAQAPPPRPATVRRPAALKLRPDPAAPSIGSVQAHDKVTVTPGRGGYALVETASGQRGYAPVADVQGASSRSLPPASAPAGAAVTPDEVRTLAGSNAARRDSFAQSVAVSEQAAGGFELSS
ncbi:MAG: hypothetical protein J0H91_10125 [Rhodospirillales bacterium]|nr:hypothetical protein [Rhodospirillales bacterium]